MLLFKTNYFGTVLTVQGGNPSMTTKMDTFKRTLNISQGNQGTLSYIEGASDIGPSLISSCLPVLEALWKPLPSPYAKNPPAMLSWELGKDGVAMDERARGENIFTECHWDGFNLWKPSHSLSQVTSTRWKAMVFVLICF